MSAARPGASTLMATTRSRRVSRPRYTSPMPPAPTASTNSYGPRRVPVARVGMWFRLFLDVPLEHAPAHDAAVDVALSIDANAFGAGVIRGGRLLILDERRHAAIARAADADALLDAGQLTGSCIDGARFRVRYIDRVVGRNRNSARPSELPPLV